MHKDSIIIGSIVGVILVIACIYFCSSEACYEIVTYDDFMNITAVYQSKHVVFHRNSNSITFTMLGRNQDITIKGNYSVGITGLTY